MSLAAKKKTKQQQNKTQWCSVAERGAQGKVTNEFLVTVVTFSGCDPAVTDYPAGVTAVGTVRSDLIMMKQTHIL